MAEPVSISTKSPLHQMHTYPGFSVTLHDESQSCKVYERKDVLRKLYIAPLICQAVQLLVDPDMRAGINERACRAHNVLVVSLALDIDLNLLHVRRPVDFCVCGCCQLQHVPRVLAPETQHTGHFVNDEPAERSICDKKKWRYPFCVLGI